MITAFNHAGTYSTIGDLFLYAKNSTSKEHFFDFFNFLGDPTTPLPSIKMRLNTLELPDTVCAQEKFVLKGSFPATLSDNSTISVVVWSPYDTLRTFGDENDPIYEFKTNQHWLFKSELSANTSGFFEQEIILPEVNDDTNLQVLVLSQNGLLDQYLMIDSSIVSSSCAQDTPVSDPNVPDILVASY